MTRSDHPTAGPDQLAAIGSYIADEWGDHNVEVELANANWGCRSYVMFRVHFGDGGEAKLLVDSHCNIEPFRHQESLADCRDRLEARIAAALALLSA